MSKKHLNLLSVYKMFSFFSKTQKSTFDDIKLRTLYIRSEDLKNIDNFTVSDLESRKIIEFYVSGKIKKGHNVFNLSHEIVPGEYTILDNRMFLSGNKISFDSDTDKDFSFTVKVFC